MDSNVFSKTATDSVGTEAARFGREVKRELVNALFRGREVASEVATEARGAAADLSQRGRHVKKLARGFASEGRQHLSRATEHVSSYADDNTALVAGGAFALGLLLGHFLTRRS